MYIVKHIDRLVRREGYRYQEIAVICGDVESYQGHLNRFLAEAKIPYFIDYKENVLMNPMV